MDNRTSLFTATFLTVVAAAAGSTLSLSACSSDPAAAVASDAGADTGPADAPVDAGPDSISSAPAVGSIAIFSSAFSDNQNANIVFDSNPHASAACVETVSGSCRINQCTLDDAGAAQPPIVTEYASAGTVSFAGGTPAASFMATPNPDGSYGNPMFTPKGGQPFKGGETATLMASGDKVPAFTQTLTYPLLFILSQPGIGDGGSPTIMVSRAQDFTFAWSRGTADADVIVQGFQSDPGTSVSLSCKFASADGTGTIPQAILMKMDAATKLTLYSAGKTTTQAGAYAVTTYLAGELLSPSKTQAVSFLLQ